MAFPPRSRTARAEPSFIPLGAAPRDAMPLRAAAPRAAGRPTANDTGDEREPMRLSAEPRRGLEAPLALTDADRVVVSSAITGGGREPRHTGGFFRVLGFAVLLVLAAVGAYSLYLEIGPYLP